jgi:serine carboxypeptidase-like clade 2
MYSGYLQIQAKPEISIHYIFITSMRNSPKDDLTVWLNGGPGCSSLLGNILSNSRIRSRSRPKHAHVRIKEVLFNQEPLLMEPSL